MPDPNPPAARYALNLLLDGRDRLLLLKRAPAAELGPGQWGLPAGGIEPGETPAAAAAREMEEEIGPGHATTPITYRGPLRDTFYGGRYEIHLFLARWLDGTVRLNHEHTAFAWVSQSEIAAYDVMPGIEEDIALLDFWPRSCLNPARLPDYLRP